MIPQEVNELLAIRSYCKTDKAHSISYQNILYSLYDKNNNRVSFKEKSAILISKKLDGNIISPYMGEKLILIKIDYKFLTSSQKDQYENQRRLRPNFSAPHYHPWGYKVFMYWLKLTNNLSRYLSK